MHYFLLGLTLAFLVCGCRDSAPDTGTISEAVDMANVPDFTVEIDRDIPLTVGDAMTVEEEIHRYALVAVGHRFSDQIGVNGRSITLMVLSETGEFMQPHLRTDLEHDLAAMSFDTSGEKLIVASEDGFVSRLHADADMLALDGRLALNAHGITTVVPSQTGMMIISRDPTETGGIYWVKGGNGFSVDAFLPLRLAYAASDCGNDRYFVVGGQTQFEPIRDEDVQMVRSLASNVQIEAEADLFDDIFDVYGLAVSSACEYAVFGNRSMFSQGFGELHLIDLRAGLPSLLDTVETEQDFNGVQHLERGDLFLVSSFESETISVYNVENNRLILVDALTGQGLISGVAALANDDGYFLVIASIHARLGSRLGVARLDMSGTLSEPVWQSLPAGSENIPSLLSVSGWQEKENAKP